MRALRPALAPALLDVSQGRGREHPPQQVCDHHQIRRGHYAGNKTEMKPSLSVGISFCLQLVPLSAAKKRAFPRHGTRATYCKHPRCPAEPHWKRWVVVVGWFTTAR